MKTPKIRILIRIGIAIFFLWLAFSLLTYAQFVVANVIRDPWIRQSIGNYLDSSLSSEEKRNIGMQNCACPPLTIQINNKAQKQWNKTIEDLLTRELTVKRVRCLLKGELSPYVLEAVMPHMKYGKGKVVRDKLEQPIKAKLTGGQIDHFDSERVSVRIKSDSAIIESINQVNFYNPKARLGGISEWFAAELMNRFDLISLRSGYVDLMINGKHGIYFFQEHPSIDMLVDLGRKPGLIVRVNASANRDSQKNNVVITGYYDENALSVDFLENQLRVLRNQVIDVNAGLIPVSQLFSLTKLAKFSAVIDLVNGYHATEFRNAFFYYNPEDSLLEPIGREFGTNQYMTNGPHHRPIRNHFRPYCIDNVDNTFFIGRQLFMPNSDANIFLDQYFQHLDIVSKKSYLDSVFAALESDLQKRQACLYLGNPEFPSFDSSHYYNNQKAIKKYLKIGIHKY